MMIRSTIMLGVLGLASPVFAQNFSLSLVPSDQVVNTSAGAVTMNVAVHGDADVGTHMLGGAFSMVSNSPNVVGMNWTPAPWSIFNTDGGFAGDGNYNEVIYGQLWPLGGIIPPAPGSELGMEIGTFEITLSGLGVLEFDLLAGSMYTLETVNEFHGTQYLDTDGTLSLGSALITLVPTPATIGPFGLALMIGSQRRRSGQAQESC